MALLYARLPRLCAPLVNFSQIRQLRFVLVKPVCASWFSNQSPAVCPSACCPAIAAGSGPELPEALCSCKFAHSFANAPCFFFGFAALLRSQPPAVCSRLLPGNCRRSALNCPEALQPQIRPFVCQRRVFRLCGAAAEPAACRLPRLLPGNCRRVRPELSEALQLQIRPFVCQRRVCGLLFAHGRSGFAALRPDQLHQIGRLRPAKSAEAVYFPAAPVFCCFFSHFSAFVLPFQAAFRRSRAAVIMPVQSDTPAAAPRFSVVRTLRVCAGKVLLYVYFGSGVGCYRPRPLFGCRKCASPFYTRGHSICFTSSISSRFPLRKTVFAALWHIGRGTSAWFIARRQAGACGRGLRVRSRVAPAWLRHPAPPRFHLGFARKTGACRRSAPFRLRRNRAGRSSPPPGVREAACGEGPAFAGPITSLRRPTFLALRK